MGAIHLWWLVGWCRQVPGSLRWSCHGWSCFLFGDGGLRSKNSPRNHEIGVSFEGRRSLPNATVKLGEVSNGLKEVTVRRVHSIQFHRNCSSVVFSYWTWKLQGCWTNTNLQGTIGNVKFLTQAVDRWTYRTCFKPSDCHDNSRPKTPIKISREMVPVCLKGCLRNSPTKSSNHTNSGKKHRVLQASTIHIA